MIANTALLHPSAVIGEGSQLWDYCQIREGARVGRECIVGRNVYIDAGVVIGDRCKIQNNALVYAPAMIDAGVFIGPAAVITNDRLPRAVNPEGQRKRAEDWVPQGIVIKEGASVGAGAVIVAGVTVGRWAMVGAGAIVNQDVADHALVGGVPAQQIGWVAQDGSRLHHRSGVWFGGDGKAYEEMDTGLRLRE